MIQINEYFTIQLYFYEMFWDIFWGHFGKHFKKIRKIKTAFLPLHIIGNRSLISSNFPCIRLTKIHIFDTAIFEEGKFTTAPWKFHFTVNAYLHAVMSRRILAPIGFTYYVL